MELPWFFSWFFLPVLLHLAKRLNKRRFNTPRPIIAVLTTWSSGERSLKTFLRWILRNLFFLTFLRNAIRAKHPEHFRFWSKNYVTLNIFPQYIKKVIAFFPRGDSFHSHTISLVLVYATDLKCSLWNLYQQGNHSGFTEQTLVIPHCL